MYLGGKETRRPKGPAKLKGILEKRDSVLSKWREGRIFARSIFFFEFCVRIINPFAISILNRFVFLLGGRNIKRY